MQTDTVVRPLNRFKSKTPSTAQSAGHFVLATSYSRTTYRRTTIGAAAFHFRVRNGNGWCHCALIARVRNRTGSEPDWQIFAAVAATQARGRISGDFFQRTSGSLKSTYRKCSAFKASFYKRSFISHLLLRPV